MPENPPEDTPEVLNTLEEATETIRETWSRQKKSWDIIADPAVASLLIDVQEYKYEYLKMIERGVKLRVLLTVNKENMNKCLELMRLAEVRHLEKTIGNFGVGASEYLSTTDRLQEGKPVVQLIRGTDPIAVKKHQELFEELWNRSAPAKLRVRELKETTHF